MILEENSTTTWQRDPKSGRWFRKVGNIVEYEPEIFTASGRVVRASQLTEHNEDSKRVDKENIEKSKNRPEKKLCPLRGLLPCRTKCAMREGEECCIGAKTPKAVKGRYCPVANGFCTDQCVFYSNNECKYFERDLL